MNFDVRLHEYFSFFISLIYFSFLLKFSFEFFSDKNREGNAEFEKYTETSFSLTESKKEKSSKVRI